jgi:hypothetical protein
VNVLIGRGAPAAILTGLAAACVEPAAPGIGLDGIWPPSRVDTALPTLA